MSEERIEMRLEESPAWTESENTMMTTTVTGGATLVTDVVAIVEVELGAVVVVTDDGGVVEVTKGVVEEDVVDETAVVVTVVVVRDVVWGDVSPIVEVIAVVVVREEDVVVWFTTTDESHLYKKTLPDKPTAFSDVQV